MSTLLRETGKRSGKCFFRNACATLTMMSQRKRQREWIRLRSIRGERSLDVESSDKIWNQKRSLYYSVVLCYYIYYYSYYMFDNMIISWYGLIVPPYVCPVLFRMRCYQRGCGRRTRPRKLPRAPFRETTCWPTWRNRPRSIPIKKTWCPSLGRREVRGKIIHFVKLKLKCYWTLRDSSVWVLSSAPVDRWAVGDPYQTCLWEALEGSSVSSCSLWGRDDTQT